MPHSRAKNAPRGVCFVCGAVTEEHWHKECKEHREGRLARQYAHARRRHKMWEDAAAAGGRTQRVTAMTLAESGE